MATTEDDLRDVQAALYRKQARWETPKAVAMILLASAAIAASARLADWVSPPRPQTITVHMDAPLQVRP